LRFISTIQWHTVAAAGVAGTILDVLGNSYLAYDLSRRPALSENIIHQEALSFILI
jgi:hypothetical protein